MTNITIKELAEKLLNRPLLETEGIKQTEIDKIELKLNLSLPDSLKDLYLLIGKNFTLLESFNKFALPVQLQKVDDKILFLEEDQEESYWAFEANGELDPKVFQLYGDNQWHQEDLSLSRFIALTLYYNCAQGGYEFTGISNISMGDLEIFTHTEWEEVVNYNSLRIFWKQECLLWYIYNENNSIDNLYFSALTQELYDAHIQKYELKEL